MKSSSSKPFSPPSLTKTICNLATANHMPKNIIYRRAFNPKEGSINPRQVVATFATGCEAEAQSCYDLLHQLSTSFNDVKAYQSHQKWRYQLVEIAPPVMHPSEAKGIQVDTSNAKKTPRPITYQLSWSIAHGECECLAWHNIYGTIRGTVEDSPAGRNLFVNRIASVWPNAKMVKH